MSEIPRRKAPDPEGPARAPADPIARTTDRLMARALSLDAMFDTLAEQAAHARRNGWPTLGDRYTRLALRAQSHCRHALGTILRTGRARHAGRGDAE